MVPTRLDFRVLKRQVSLAQVMATEGLLKEFRLRGARLIGPCPLHHGNNKHGFVVERHRSLWYCFGDCQEGGDLVAFVQRLHGLSYQAVARYLSEFESLENRQPGEFGERTIDREAALRVPEKAARAGKSRIEEINESRRGGRAHRGGEFKGQSLRLQDDSCEVPTSPRVIFQRYERRLLLNPNTPFVVAKGIRAQTARAFEVGAYTGKGWLTGCIGVRLHDPLGFPLGYAGRRIIAGEVERWGKWKVPRGLPKARLLYNYHRARAAGSHACVLAECPWSVLRLHQLGIPAVGLMGTTLSGSQRALLSPWPRIILLLDGDTAGRKATHALRRQLRDTHQVISIYLASNTDPDDLCDHELARLMRPALLHGHVRGDGSRPVEMG